MSKQIQHEAQTVAPYEVGRHKREFNQETAAAYACNGSGQISPRTIRRATEDGELHPVKVGHKWLYTRAEIDAWLLAKARDEQEEARDHHNRRSRFGAR